jgi:biotin carboxylase
MRKVLVTFPNAWDAKQLESCRSSWDGRYEVAFGDPTDEGCPWDFDIMSYIERVVAENEGRLEGIASSSDYPGATVAGAVATRLGLPGSPPESVIRCSHKYYSRLAQRESVPEATADFELLDPRQPDAAPQLGFPFFIKPVKGAFSVMSRRIDDAGQLRAFLSRPSVAEFLESYLHIFNQLVGGLTDLEIDGRYFLVEELLRGEQVTVEGFTQNGGVEIVGIVDSVVHPDTGSFVRFDYPSRLGDDIQRRLADVAERVMTHLGLESSFFNIEMIHDPASGRIGIIEINPRICGQFGDLYQKVDGVNSYEMVLELACGARPRRLRRQGPHAVASSFPLRIYQPARVASAPDDALIREVEREFDDTLIWSECTTGQNLTDFESIEDGLSIRYAVINTGSSSQDELMARFEAIVARLNYSFEYVGIQ